MSTIMEAFTTTSSADAAEQDVARRAYEIYLERGGQDGHALDHWLEAERELSLPSATPETPA